MSEERMNEGDSVVLYSAKNKFNSIALTKQKTRIFGVMKNVTCLIGQPYGSVYEIFPGSDTLTRRCKLSEKGSAQMISDGRDNRDVRDDARNQKLTMDDIEELKANAERGNQIVEALVENSETYERKTEFAQEKYLSRKAKKYCTTFSALKPTIATVCETQFDWYAVKTSFLRLDSLSVILSLANVGSYRRVLVVDNCFGMLTAAVVEKLGGLGDICLGYFGRKPNKLETLKRFYNSEPENLYKIPLVELIDLKKAYEESDDAMMDTMSERTVEKTQIPSEKLRNWLKRGFDSCIVADWKVQPCALIDGVLPLLSPSASFVLYSAGLTSLVECHYHLLQRDDAILVELQNLWWREYQVMPGRTRPMMDAKCPSGYILSGTKVQFTEPPPLPPSDDSSKQGGKHLKKQRIDVNPAE